MTRNMWPEMYDKKCMTRDIWHKIYMTRNIWQEMYDKKCKTRNMTRNVWQEIYDHVWQEMYDKKYMTRYIWPEITCFPSFWGSLERTDWVAEPRDCSSTVNELQSAYIFLLALSFYFTLYVLLFLINYNSLRKLILFSDPN